MAEDLMRYDLLAQDALRGVVRFALKRVEKTGLPGEHHFYIAFDTTSPGVRISERLRNQYPQEMTIVIQHQYKGLKVMDERFQLELSFDNIPEKLVIPFDAIKGFFDPSVQFGLQFEIGEANENTGPDDSAENENVNAGSSVKTSGDTSSAADQPAADDDIHADELDGDGEKIVQLDAFRKK